MFSSLCYKRREKSEEIAYSVLTDEGGLGEGGGELTPGSNENKDPKPQKFTFALKLLSA